MNSELFWRASDICWPPIQKKTVGPWVIREGGGGGSRVSSTTPIGDCSRKDISLAEREMHGLGQSNVFQIRRKDKELDLLLSKKGYSLVDRTVIYKCNIAEISCLSVPSVTTFDIWPPLNMMKIIWDKGGITDGRLSVMRRCKVKKTTILGRIENKAAGCAFVSQSNGISIIQSLFVLPKYSRKGLARHVIIEAAKWGEKEGSSYLALMVGKHNKRARSLYDGLGMKVLESYHYRVKG